MKKSILYISGICMLMILFFSLSSCQKTAGAKDSEQAKTQPAGMQKQTQSFNLTEEWKKYWYAGKAELTSYNLKQSRYGEMHDGTVVFIFVTEDFSKSKEVKLDNAENAKDDKISILKLNQSVKFITGIYPYSLMLSAFSPVDINNYPHALKISASAQEWCGNSFYQMNNRDGKYNIQQFSYFESEGDKQVKLDNTIVEEDELWNMIRLAPDRLPTGEQTILPGALYLRLSHKELQPVKANCILTEENGMMIYTINFPSLNRILNIRFEKSFPYKISGWDDTFPGLDGKTLTTKATFNKTIMSDYWAKHSNADLPLRDSLGLQEKWQ